MTADSLAWRWRSGMELTGVIVKMPAPALLELACYAGFDVVVIDTEHGPTGGGLLEDHLRAADAAGIPVIIRVGKCDPAEILAALDAGAHGVIVPHVSTAADARAAVDAAHYPPVGARGFALSTRAGRYGTTTAEQHLTSAADRTLVIAQIEDASAIEHSAAIAATPHLDGVWIGPSDLSLALGHPGNPAHPEVAAAIDTITHAVRRANSARLCALAADPAQARDWRERGASLVLFSAIDIIASRFSQLTGVRQPHIAVQEEVDSL